MAQQALRKGFHVDLASTLLADIQNKTSHYYHFIGKTKEWDSTVPQVGTDTDLNDDEIRSNAILLKKISHNDVSVMINRINWTSGTVYDIYDSSVDMSTKNFYVLTDDYNVYKCLNNNGAIPSTIKPSGQSYTTTVTSDGYVWKFMYAIPVYKRTKFLTPTYMPVQKALTDSFYNNGSIDNVAVDDSGSGYADTVLTTCTVTGAGAGSGCTMTIVRNPTTGTITSVNVTNGGTGYTAGIGIRINTTYGSGAILTPVITSGVVTSVTVVDGGFGYQSGDTITTFVGGAVLVPIVSNGKIVDVYIKNAGAGYASVPSLAVGVVAGQTAGTGLYTGHATALLTAVIDKGQIVRVLINDPGQNYPIGTSTMISISGDGTGAAFKPNVYEGKIISVSTENSGTGYTWIKLTLDGSGTGAVIRPVMSTSDYISNQSIVEQTAVRGAIYAIKVMNGGTHYSTNTTIAITGDGTGATAVPTIVNGVVTKVSITAPGTGYTWATAALMDPNRNIAPVDAVDGVLSPVIPPKNGHGYDAVQELNGHVFCAVSTIKNEYGIDLFKIEQEYRQYGILKNPRVITSGKIFNKDADAMVYMIKVSHLTNIVEDEILVSSGVKFRVVSFDTINLTMTLQKLSDMDFDLYQKNLTAETNSARSYSVLDVTDHPTANKYTGRLLYVSNETPLVINNTQSLTIRTLIAL